MQVEANTTYVFGGRQMVMDTDSVAIVSGGLDSTTLVYDMIENGMSPHMLSFNYGQRHKKELGYAADTAKRLHLPHDIIDLTAITHLISNSALTSVTHRGVRREDLESREQYEGR